MRFNDMKYMDREYLQGRLLQRENETHKRNYGHLLLVCGCDSMPGAAVLATGAALRSGCGLVTLHSSRLVCSAAIGRHPSAMLSIDAASCFSSLPDDIGKYSCIAAGPGLGRAPETASALSALLREARAAEMPMVIDADALNIISSDREFLSAVPEGSVMTPHDGELTRFVGGWDTEEGKVEKVRRLAESSGCTVISKGYHTKVVFPDGEILINTTGNPGMAKGGSGDVLTGLVAGLMARGYPSWDAAALGVWIHGFAGDCLTAERTAEAYDSSALVDYLHIGFRELYG